MNILSITGILPIPGKIKDNDFVFQTYLNGSDFTSKHKILIIRTTQYKTNIKKVITKSTDLNKLEGKKKLIVNGLNIEIFPFFSTRRIRNFHALICYSIYYLNKKRISKLINTNNFHIIHAQYLYPDGLLAYILYKKYGIPYVITTHDERKYFDHIISRKIGMKILKNARRVVPINFTNATYFRSQGLSNVTVIPLGVRKEFFCPVIKKKSDIVKVLTVSSFLDWKNVDKVIQAFSNLSPHYNITLTLIGTGPEKAKLYKMVVSLDIQDRVKFLDQISNDKVAIEMQKHDIFILPSYFETFGRVFFEAMAAGLPIICARDSGVYGLFEDGKEGLGVYHNNINSITEGLERLIKNTDMRIEMGNLGQQFVKKYTWEEILRQLLEVYRESIN